MKRRPQMLHVSNHYQNFCIHLKFIRGLSINYCFICDSLTYTVTAYCTLPHICVVYFLWMLCDYMKQCLKLCLLTIMNCYFKKKKKYCSCRLANSSEKNMWMSLPMNVISKLCAEFEREKNKWITVSQISLFIIKFYHTSTCE